MTAPMLRLLSALLLLVLSVAAAVADCPAAYAQRERALLDAHYLGQAKVIAEWRDRQFRFAIDRFKADYGAGAKPIYDRLSAEKARLSERIVEGDLRHSAQRQRSEAGREIGARFRADIAALNRALRQRYRDQIARIRADVAAMRQATAESYETERQALQATIAGGCREEARPRLRSIFVSVSQLIGPPARQDPVDIPYGAIGRRG